MEPEDFGDEQLDYQIVDDAFRAARVDAHPALTFSVQAYAEPYIRCSDRVNATRWSWWWCQRWTSD